MASELKNPMVEMNKIEPGGIPALEFVPPQKLSYGGMIYYHGWSSCKENQIFRASTMASHGWRVLVPDARNHGERGELNYDEQEIVAEHFFPVLINSIEEADLLLGYLEEKLGDSSPLAAAGHSMGGFTVAGILTADAGEKLASAVCVNGSGAWLKTVDMLLEEAARREGGEESGDPEDFEIDVDKSGLEKYDPFHSSELLADVPLLLLHGEDDSSVPLAAQRHFYEKALKVYRERGREKQLELEVYENLNHYYTTGMLAHTISWLGERSQT